MKGHKAIRVEYIDLTKPKSGAPRLFIFIGCMAIENKGLSTLPSFWCQPVIQSKTSNCSVVNIQETANLGEL